MCLYTNHNLSRLQFPNLLSGSNQATDCLQLWGGLNEIMHVKYLVSA